MVHHLIVRTLLWTAGALFLALFSYTSLRTALEQLPADAPVRWLKRRSCVTGLLMALLNPMGILFWLSIGGGLVASGVQQAGTTGTIAIIGGVIAGLGIWVTGLSTVVSSGRWLASPSVLRLGNLAGSVLLFGFTVWFAWQAIGAVR